MGLQLEEDRWDAGADFIFCNKIKSYLYADGNELQRGESSHCRRGSAGAMSQRKMREWDEKNKTKMVWL